jgi:hypothetical protein
MDAGFEPHAADAEVQMPDDNALISERHRVHRSAGQLQDPIERRGESHVESTTRSRSAVKFSQHEGGDVGRARSVADEDVRLCELGLVVRRPLSKVREGSVRERLAQWGELIDRAPAP